MIPEDFRKLKRGLKDISPLFEGETHDTSAPMMPAAPVLMAPAVESAGFRLAALFSPIPEASPLLLSQILVSRLLVQNRQASILSLGLSEKAPQSGNLNLSWEKFQEICETSGRTSISPEISHTLFLDFDYANLEQFQKTIPLLDQWILVVRPDMESLTESYRMMKASQALNGRLEYFLLFDNRLPDDQASRFFEKYGEFVSRRLGIHLSWLGSIQQKTSRGYAPGLAVETLFMKSSLEHRSVEKKAISGFLSQSLRQAR